MRKYLKTVIGYIQKGLVSAEASYYDSENLKISFQLNLLELVFMCFNYEKDKIDFSATQSTSSGFFTNSQVSDVSSNVSNSSDSHVFINENTKLPK